MIWLKAYQVRVTPGLSGWDEGVSDRDRTGQKTMRLASATDRLAVNSDSYATSRRITSAIQDALGFRAVAWDPLIQIFESNWTAGLMRAWTRQLYLIWRRNTLRMRSKFRYEIWHACEGYARLVAASDFQRATQRPGDGVMLGCSGEGTEPRGGNPQV